MKRLKMMNDVQKFELLSSIYDEIKFNDDFHQGTLLINNLDTLRNVKFCLDDIDTYGLSTLTDVDSIEIGQKITFNRGEPLPRIGSFHLNFEEFLSGDNLIRFPRRGFYLLDKKLSTINSSFEEDENIVKYKKIIDFIKHILIPSSVYFDKDSCTLIYLDDNHKKIEVPILYTVEDLKKIDIQTLDSLRDQFFEDIHLDQKYAIIAEVVKGFCSPVSKRNRFQELLNSIDELLKSFNNGYKLFAAKFSYESIKDEVETAKIEEMAKLHKIISDVQNHILGIPVATVIVATQMKVATDSTSQILINTCITIGALFFTLLITFIMHNQSDTLNSLENEIIRKKELIAKEYAKIEKIINPSFDDLFDRVEFQRCVLKSVISIVWIGFFVALVAYVLLSFKL